ncbi:MAG: exodeoxyribonuclease VII small subunit [Nitrospirota bacterium]|nr:exodeoxyribonuclease VII small subunit [Nitrospirota bacterium]
MAGSSRRTVSRKETPSFEPSLARLEEIVRLLEEGDQTLEKSLTLFEEGVGLSRRCLEVLGNAERTVEKLMRDKGIVAALNVRDSDLEDSDQEDEEDHR